MPPTSRRSVLRLGGVALASTLGGCAALGQSGGPLLDWKVTVEGGEIDSPPQLSNGFVYVGVSEGDVLAIDAETGDVEWRRPGNGLLACPAVGGGYLVTPTRWGTLYGLDAATGDIEWERSVPSPFGRLPTSTISERTVFLATLDDVRALDLETGNVLWRQSFQEAADGENAGFGVSGAPVVADGTVYLKAGPGGENFSALDAATGDILWTATTGPQMGPHNDKYAPAVGEDSVFVGTHGGTVHAFDRATGDERWKFYTDGPTTSPTLADGRLFFGAGEVSEDSTLFAVDPDDRTTLWEQTLYGTQWYANPTVHDGTVYVGHWADGDSDRPPGVAAFDAESGDRKWDVDVSSNVSAKLAVDDERVYVPAGRRLYGITK